MYPAAFRYYRAATLEEAASILSQAGDEARPLAGGQSLIPLMKLRLVRPELLVDLNSIPGLSSIKSEQEVVRIGALARHAQLADSELSQLIPILHDCAAGIADAQVRSRGTIGGSLAEADPSGDWAPVMLALSAKVRTQNSKQQRTIALGDFLKDAYTTALANGELVREVAVKVPAKNSGGAYIAFKRCASVYASASAAVQLTMADRSTCEQAHIYLGCVGLVPLHATAAEAELRGRELTKERISAAAEAAMEAAAPHSDMRGSAEYKKVLVKHVVKKGLEVSLLRSGGEQVEVSHEYVGRI